MSTIKFTDLEGKASKAGPERFKPVNGINKIRLVGPIVPAYKYWLKTQDNNSVPMECLGFNRDTEKFENKVKDWVRHYFPDMKCSWAYQGYVLDREDGKIKLFDHKKKLFNAILDAAKKKLGDPTDFEKGWDVVFEKKKTGPAVFNVEYALETFSLEHSALTPEEIELYNSTAPIEEVTKLQSPEDQKAFIIANILPDESSEEALPEEATTEFDDDIPH